MDLATDSSVFTICPQQWEKKLTERVLEQIVEDLDTSDKVSLLFLFLAPEENSFENVLKILNCENSKEFTKYLMANVTNWEAKLLEGLCLTQNKKILTKLGLTLAQCKDLETVKYSRSACIISSNLNVVAKCLYMLCESLNSKKTQNLINLVYKDVPKNEFFEKILDYEEYLEMHIFYWIREKYIEILGAEGNMTKLLEMLKKMDLMDHSVYLDLRKLNQTNIERDAVGNCQISSLVISESNHSVHRNKNKKYLCIIINEVEYGPRHERRQGSDFDQKKLIETFKGCNFDIESHDNLPLDKFTDVLRTLRNYSSYSVIVLCILSHGKEGCMITTDDKKMNLSRIEQMICCPELENSIKIVIVQCCLGPYMGTRNFNLTTDGPRDMNVTRFSNFILLTATLDGFVATRDKTKGTWFIQELCNVIQNNEGRGLTMEKLHTEVNIALGKKKSPINGQTLAQISKITSTSCKPFVFPPYKKAELRH